MALTKISRGLLDTGVSDSSDATAITITSDENVGIGTSTINTGTLGTSNKFLEVAAGTASGSGTLVLSRDTSGNDNEVGGIRFVNANNADDDGLDADGKFVAAISARSVTSDTNASDDSGANLVFYTKPEAGNYAERMRVTSGGDVGIGITSPNEKLQVGGSVMVNNGAFYKFGDGTVRIYGETSSDILSFVTNDSERARITSSGVLLVGKTSDNTTDVGVVNGPSGYIYATRDGNIPLVLNRKTSHGIILQFRKDNTSVGSISTNAEALPSDRNFKRDISDLDLGLNLVTKLKPSQYNYKIDSEDCPKMYGLIAQDLEESLTEVGIEKNSTWLLQHNPKEDVNESDYSLDYTKLIPILINSIQELSAKVEELENKINE